MHPIYNERFISFPYAKYYIQKREFELAISGQTSSYLAEQVSMLEQFSSVVWLTEDEGIIDNLIQYQLTGGHSLYHQVAWIREQNTTFFYGGDEAPQLQQMKSKFVAKYDLDGKKAMEWRQLWWEQGKKDHWTFAFYHDITYPTHTPSTLP
jgi:hypothetical protein